jgi:methylthioribulose-1-phosphate dehydratase
MKERNSYQHSRKLLCDLLRGFYDKGWVAGTGGGICTVVKKNEVLMAPTGVHKECVLPQDLFVVDDQTSRVLRSPQNPSLRLTECNTIFCLLIREKDAGAVMHSHALSAVLAGDLGSRADCVVFESLEMLKGLRDCSNFDKHSVPVIENTAYEPELVSQIEKAIRQPDFDSSYCILVRDHGAYIWGSDLWETKRHAEVYHFLFEATTARSKRQLA